MVPALPVCRTTLIAEIDATTAAPVAATRIQLAGTFLHIVRILLAFTGTPGWSPLSVFESVTVQPVNVRSGEQSSASSPLWIPAVVGTIALSFFVRLWAMASVFGTTPDRSEALYGFVPGAKAIVEQGLDGVSGLVPPLHQLVLAIGVRFGFRVPLHMLVFEAFESALIVGLVMWLVYVLAGTRAGVIAGVIAAFYPPMWVYSAQLLGETSVQLAVLALVAASIRYVGTPSVGFAGLSGILCGLAWLGGWPGYWFVLVPIVAFVMVRRTVATKTLVVQAAVCLLSIAAVVTPWALHNRSNDRGLLSTTTSAGRIAAGANCPSTYFTMIGYQDVGCSSIAQQSIPFELAIQGDQRYDGQRDRYVMRIADSYVSDFRAKSVVVGVARVGRTVGLYRPLEQMRFDQTLEFQGHGAVVWSLWASWWLLLPFAVGGAWWCLRRSRLIAPLLAAVGVVLVSVAWIYGTVRFRASIEPLIVVLSAIGIAAISNDVVDRMGKRRLSND